MEEIVGNVREVFPEYTIDIQMPPSYVQFFSKNVKNVVMAYTKGKEPTVPSAYVNKNNTKKDDFELTGSPLKLDLSLHLVFDETVLGDEPQLWLKEELIHVPINFYKARQIANLFNEQVQELDQENCIPMWILCEPINKITPLLLTIQSYKDNFIRGLCYFDGIINYQNVDAESYLKQYRKQPIVGNKSVITTVNSKYLLSGIFHETSKPSEELLMAPSLGATYLYCEWSDVTFQVPLHKCKVDLEQEVIIGHIMSPCNSIWKSVCALQSINQLLVDMTAAGIAAIQLDKSPIMKAHTVISLKDNNRRLNNLLKEVNMYTYMVKPQKGGFICAPNKCNSLKQCLESMNKGGSSNDFTYRLWDILKDCETAEDLVTLLIHALKVISSGKMRPFIDVNNKTYLGKLVLKLSRGHSQTAKLLKNFSSNPQQTLSMVGQVGIEKTMWEFTNLMSMVEHSFFIAGIWSSEVTTNESIEQINQTLYDMTLGGDFTLNPFENKSSAENSIRIDCESFYEDDDNDLTVDDFASLKQLGLSEKKSNEVPLIADEIDISGWKNLLMKFAQVHVCLEHLNRAQDCLKVDIAALKPVATRLREHFVSDKSPIKTVGQLINEPINNIKLPIDTALVKEHLLKPAYWYRIMFELDETNLNKPLLRNFSETRVLTQQPIFPPYCWKHIEPQPNECDTTVLGDLNYYSTCLTTIHNVFCTDDGAHRMIDLKE